MRAADIGKAMSALLSSSIGRDDARLHLGVKSAVCFKIKVGSRGTECEAS
jgi:hypothetical protein